MYLILNQLTSFLPNNQYIAPYIFTCVFLLHQVVKAMKGVVVEKEKEPYKCKTVGILM